MKQSIMSMTIIVTDSMVTLTRHYVVDDDDDDYECIDEKILQNQNLKGQVKIVNIMDP